MGDLKLFTITGRGEGGAQMKIKDGLAYTPNPLIISFFGEGVGGVKFIYFLPKQRYQV